MKVNKIDHICVAVRNLEQARKVWEPVLGKSAPDDAYVDEPEKIRVARYWLGEVGFELMESTTPDGEVAKFIAKRGEGVMLISFNVANTRQSMDELKGRGYPFIGGARPSIADIRLAATLEFLAVIDYPLPAWAKKYMAAMEKTLGKA